MSTLTQLSGNGLEIELGGASYTVSTLTLADVGIMQEWFIIRPMAELKLELVEFGDMYTDKDKRRKVTRAREEMEVRRAVRDGSEPEQEVIDRVAADMTREFSSLEGVGKMLWLSIKKKHDVTEDDVKQLLDLNVLAAVKDTMDALTFAPSYPDADLVAQARGEEKKTDGVTP